MNNKCRNLLAIIGSIIILVIIQIGYSKYIAKENEVRSNLEKINIEYRETERQEIEKNMISVLSNSCDSNRMTNSYLINVNTVLQNDCQGTVLVDPISFCEKMKRTSAYLRNTRAKVKIDKLDINVNYNDILILQFQAYTLENNVEVEVNCGNINNRVYVNQEKRNFYIPITDVTLVDSIEFEVCSDYSPLVIDQVYLTNYYQNYPVQSLMTGIYYDSEIETTRLSDMDSIIQCESTQILKKDNFLFSLGANKITVYEKKEEIWEIVSSYDGLLSARDMVFTEDKGSIIISARQSGMYLIDITNPYQLELISHYDTLEATTGLAISGDFVFLCSRYFGVEVVDISDKKNPKCVNVIGQNLEYQDCYVEKNYLFVGVYAQKKVHIYNIEDISNPVFMSEIELDGAGQGLTVKDEVLYVATGLNSNNDYTNISKWGKGTGNGMEIYNVSDPYNPQLLSKVKTEGRMWIDTSDVWDVQVAGNYAYVTNMYNGIYIYDISDAHFPKLIEKIYIAVDIDSPYYKEFDENKYLVSWNQQKEGRGCVYHTIIEDGKIYLCSPKLGVFEIERKEAVASLEPSRVLLNMTEKNEPVYELENFTSKRIEKEASAWATCVKDDYLFVAYGEKGVYLYDINSLTEIASLDTEYSVKDIKVYGDYFVTAESEGGIGFYSFHNDVIEEIYRIVIDKNKYNISQIEITNNGKYIIAQASPYKHIIFDIENAKEIQLLNQANVGAMYYRNIVSGKIANKYIGVYGSNSICFYGEGMNTELVQAGYIENAFYHESNGMCAYGDLGIIITQGGYRYFDFNNNWYSDLIKINGIQLRGKCVCKDDTLVVTDSATGQITILDISESTNPKIVERFFIDGNPDIASFSDDTIIIPCRNSGVLILKKRVNEQ